MTLTKNRTIMTPMNENEIAELATKIRATLGSAAENYRFDLDDFLDQLSISFAGRIVVDDGQEKQITEVYVAEPHLNKINITLVMEPVD